VAKILTVDDAAMVRQWCAGVLLQAGHEPIEATNGPEALRLYEQHQPDLVLLDILMPELGGLVVLKELRDRHPDARVVMLTTDAELDAISEAERLGARDYLVKPCGGRDLLSAVQQALS
jgi:two-component system chemotaxis response regulator CheY